MWSLVGLGVVEIAILVKSDLLYGGLNPDMTFTMLEEAERGTGAGVIGKDRSPGSPHAGTADQEPLLTIRPMDGSIPYLGSNGSNRLPAVDKPRFLLGFGASNDAFLCE